MAHRLPDGEAFESHYEDLVHARAGRRGTLPAAGVFLAQGRFHVAEYGGAAEHRLRARGAVAVAEVSFGGAPVPALTGGGAGRLTAPLLPLPLG